MALPQANTPAHRAVVLTGGPGSGKTVLSALLAARFPDRFALVPEAASQVYADLRTRWDRSDAERRRDIQRRIYRLQLDQEERVARSCSTGARSTAPPTGRTGRRRTGRSWARRSRRNCRATGG